MDQPTIANYFCLFDHPQDITFEALAYLDDLRVHDFSTRNALVEISAWPKDNQAFWIHGRSDRTSEGRHWMSYQCQYHDRINSYILLDRRTGMEYMVTMPF